MRVKQTRGMEDGYVHNSLVQLLRQEQVRSIRMSRFVVLTLLLVLAALGVLSAAVIQGRGHPAGTEVEEMTQPYRLSAALNEIQEQPRSFQSPSAMLTAPQDVHSEGGFLQWESKIGNAYCHGGFNYSSGSLLVPRKGLYRVFLQITFESRRQPCGNDEQLNLSNIVFLSQDNYCKDVPLLSSEDTLICSGKPWSKSLYTAGLFSLEANGRLRVRSSNSELISRKQELVFFGAELVP